MDTAYQLESSKLFSCEGKHLNTGFDGLGFGVVETGSELASSAFEFSKDTFDTIPISVCFLLESVAMAV